MLGWSAYESREHKDHKKIYEGPRRPYGYDNKDTSGDQ